MADLDELALAMPETTKEVSEDGRPSYLVHGKMFCFHRGRRPDAVDPATGERLDDVLMFRVEDLDVKELVLADDRGIFFTTPHFNGYPGGADAHPGAGAARPRSSCATSWSRRGSRGRRSGSRRPGSTITSRTATDGYR